MENKYVKLKAQLQGLNSSLNQRWETSWQRSELRAKLVDQVGSLETAGDLSEAEIGAWTQGRGVVAVDGSINGYGGNYPYYISIFRALARSTQGYQVETTDFFTPLDEKGFQAITEQAEATGLGPESCAERIKTQRLAQMEIQVALEALKIHQPKLMLMDGGFLRLQRANEELWQEFREQALLHKCVVVGVIEEVGTFQLASLLGIQPANSGERLFDREVLFGNLNVGEWLRVQPGQAWKHDYYTCFGRFSRHPQATGFDLFPEDLSELTTVMNFIANITPEGSRGIPLWLDIIDNEVRVSHQEIEMLINSTLDPGCVEKLLTAQRHRRDY